MSVIPLLEVHNLTSLNNILILGKINTGKTELIKHIVSLQEPNTKIYLFVRDTNDYNIKGMSQKQVYKNCLDTITNQESTIKKLVIFEDVLLNDLALIKEYLANSRNYNIINVIALSFDRLKPELQNLIDVIMLFGDNAISNRQRYHERYFGFITKFEIYNQMFEKYTENYRLLCTTKGSAYYYEWNQVNRNTYFRTEPMFTNITIKTEDNNYDDEPVLKPIEIIKTDKYYKLEMINKIVEQNEKLIKMIEEL